MSKKSSEQKQEVPGENRISRRKFLGTVAGTGAALTVSGLLSGCKPGGAAQTSTTPDVQVTSTATGVTYPFGVHEADILIIGGGLSGLFAAKKAIAEGATVMIVDKGPFGHSGASGINWGHDMSSNETSPDDGSSAAAMDIIMQDGMTDQLYSLGFVKEIHEAKPILTNESMGLFAERDENGDSMSKYAPGTAENPSILDHGCFPRAWAQYARRKGARVFDRTMVVKVLLSDKGEAAGAVAINLVTGDAVVFRSKAVIMATGSYAWCYGWTGNTACSITGPECTGDGTSMFLNMGLEMRDMEQLPFDCVQIYPTSTAYGMGTLGLSVVNHQYALNKNGERYTQMLDTMPSNTLFMRLTMKEVHEGRALDNGCVLFDTVDLDKLNRYYRRARTRNRMIGYELPDKAELHWEFWESAARPATVSPQGETAIPGLYYAGTGTGAYQGSGFWNCTGSGYMCGKYAASKVKEMDRPSVVWSQVQDALTDAYTKLDVVVDKGARPLTVYHKIQQAMWNGLSPLRDEKGIQGAIDTLLELKEKEFPLISVPLKSRRYNSEWKYAMEIPNMWNCVMGTAQAALIRKETRGTHCRTDYPKMDNENWMVNTLVKLDNGQWVALTKPIVDAVIPAAELAKYVPPYGLEW